MSAAFNHIRAEIRYNNAVVDEYRALLREVMLHRLVCMSMDPAFLALVDELCELLGCTEQYAAMQLYPVSSAIYRAAEAAHA